MCRAGSPFFRQKLVAAEDDAAVFVGAISAHCSCLRKHIRKRNQCEYVTKGFAASATNMAKLEKNYRFFSLNESSTGTHLQKWTHIRMIQCLVFSWSRSVFIQLRTN